MGVRRRFQRGYLFEVPIILVLLSAGIILLMPRLPPTGRRVLAVVAAAPVLVLLYALIVAPGWQPGGKPGRMSFRLRLAGFLLLAAALSFAVIGLRSLFRR